MSLNTILKLVLCLGLFILLILVCGPDMSLQDNISSLNLTKVCRLKTSEKATRLFQAAQVMDQGRMAINICSMFVICCFDSATEPTQSQGHALSSACESVDKRQVHQIFSQDASERVDTKKKGMTDLHIAVSCVRTQWLCWNFLRFTRCRSCMLCFLPDTIPVRHNRFYEPWKRFQIIIDKIAVQSLQLTCV